MSENEFFQSSFYVGNNFNWILYGVEIVLYTQAMYIYTTSNSADSDSTSNRVFMSFSTVMLILITVYLVVESFFGEEMWIVNANYPGGSAAYFTTYASVWYQTMGTTSSVILQLMSDGFLIYRCSVLWPDWRIIIPPCFLWLATLVFGIAQLYTSGSPHNNLFVGLAAKFCITYTAASISLNTLVTGLICGRILYYARCMQKHVGFAHADTYFNIVAIVIESALPYTLCGVAFVISYGLNSGLSILFLSLYAMFMCLSPQMLILRAASGKAWKVETAKRTTLTSLQFEGCATTDCTATHPDVTSKVALSRDEEWS